MGQGAHDAAGAALDPVAVAGYASAAAPIDVSADTDIVRAWYLRNGAQATVVTAAGALIGGDATNGLDVDVTRLPALVAGTANIGDVDVLTVPAPLSTTGGGTEATALRVTLANDSTGLVSVDDNAGSLTVDGNVGTLPITSGGCSISHLVSAATTNATNAKASAGQVYGWNIFNTNAAIRYVKLHNTAGTPTAGTAVVMTIGVPATGGNNIMLPHGIAFGTGIAFTTVTGAADSDATAVGANDLIIDLHFK